MKNFTVPVIIGFIPERKKMKLTIGLVAAIILTSTAVLADPVGGTKIAKSSIRPGERDIYQVPCLSDETTRFKVVGDGDSDLDCIVYDDLGNEVGRDTDSTDVCIIDINPRWTAVFRIIIINSGNQTNNYMFKAF